MYTLIASNVILVAQHAKVQDLINVYLVHKHNILWMAYVIIVKMVAYNAQVHNNAQNVNKTLFYNKINAFNALHCVLHVNNLILIA
jgi:hypothetical protein